MASLIKSVKKPSTRGLFHAQKLYCKTLFTKLAAFGNMPGKAFQPSAEQQEDFHDNNQLLIWPV